MRKLSCFTKIFTKFGWQDIRIYAMICDENEENNLSQQIVVSGVKSRKISIFKEFLRHDKNIIYLPRQNPYFCLKWLKIKAFGEWEWYLSPPIVPPLFCASVPRQPKSKAFGLEFVNRTVLDKNEYDLWWKKFLGEQMDRFWKTLYQFSLQINFVHRFMV